MNPLWMVVADLRKTLLASLGILVLLALGFSVTVTMSLFDRALRHAGASSAQEFDLVVGAPGSRLDLVLASVYLRTDEVLPLLDAAMLEELAADPRVAQASPLVFSDHWGSFPLVGIGESFPALRPGMVLASGRWPTQPFEVLAGAATTLNEGLEFHGSHGAEENEGGAEAVHDEVEYRVVGTLARTGTPWDRALLTPVESVWLLHNAIEAKQVSAILIKPRDFAAAYALRAEYREGATTAAFPGEVLAGLFGLFDNLKSALSLVSLLFQGLVFTAVLLSLLAALPSKAKWIGLLRALGAGPTYIFLTLWIQSALVFLLAGVVGAGMGWLGAQALSQYAAGLTGLSLVVTWSWEESVVLASLGLVGLLGALVPALAGYRTSVRRSLLGQ